ncbi:hypothetical protein GGS23DRAFT_596488 [Durotheca rogersii]|uniref:uncharacterized protein n=1 Tax=Durotheca rogersii TaxID=419775 RepID=UPI00221E9336|nr:uncharacterized protein GGS23DRAFT_596488 [Durotheca rogersii]KAI5863299.1 hypothetical protein GGS23DRAFT_596488 [Durotheca rogersii]
MAECHPSDPRLVNGERHHGLYYCVITHLSQSNYLVEICGGHYGVLQHDDFTQEDRNASIVIDLLEGREFHKGHESEALPQWRRGEVDKVFLEPPLNDARFMEKPLVSVTFDENKTYKIPNHTLNVLLGSAVPADLIGTVGDSYYNHCSEFATAEANRDLHTVGRFDIGANVIGHVDNKTGDVVRH